LRVLLFVSIAGLWFAWLLTLSARPSAWLVFGSGLPMLALTSWSAHRGHPESWRGFMRRTADVHVLAAVFLGALGVQFADAHGVTTDGVIYFTQLRSALFDRDLDVAREFAFLQQPPRPSHVVPIGPTFIWLPLYASVAAVDAAGRSLSLWSPPADPSGVGLTLPYVRAALVSSFAIGAIGLITIHFRLRREFSPVVACAATLVLFLATPLVWYTVYEPFDEAVPARIAGLRRLGQLRADCATASGVGNGSAVHLPVRVSGQRLVCVANRASRRSIRSARIRVAAPVI
jgi:hypothetical protein